jgi:hypothetical protein
MRVTFRQLREENKQLKAQIRVLNDDMTEIADRHVDAVEREDVLRTALEPAYTAWRKNHPAAKDPELDVVISWLIGRA